MWNAGHLGRAAREIKLRLGTMLAAKGAWLDNRTNSEHVDVST
jgi:hypothetical protein